MRKSNLQSICALLSASIRKKLRRSVKCIAKSQLPQWLSLFSLVRRRCLLLRMLVGRQVLQGKLLARVTLQGKILQGKLLAAPVRHIIRAHRRLALLD
jgi:hypothetical protein